MNLRVERRSRVGKRRTRGPIHVGIFDRIFHVIIPLPTGISNETFKKHFSQPLFAFQVALGFRQFGKLLCNILERMFFDHAFQAPFNALEIGRAPLLVKAPSFAEHQASANGLIREILPSDRLRHFVPFDSDSSWLHFRQVNQFLGLGVVSQARPIRNLRLYPVLWKPDRSRPTHFLLNLKHVAIRICRILNQFCAAAEIEVCYPITPRMPASKQFALHFSAGAKEFLIADRHLRGRIAQAGRNANVAGEEKCP